MSALSGSNGTTSGKIFHAEYRTDIFSVFLSMNYEQISKTCKLSTEMSKAAKTPCVSLALGNKMQFRCGLCCVVCVLWGPKCPDYVGQPENKVMCLYKSYEFLFKGFKGIHFVVMG